VIKGLTHSEDGELNKVTKYKGKISSGFAPGEGPNKENHPVAAGFFRLLKEVIVNKRIGSAQQIVAIKEWVLNEPIQTLLEKTCNGSKQPRRIEIICLYKEFYEMWESSLGMYSGTEGLLCKGHGLGTDAKYLKFNGDERVWTKRPCLYEECPDFKAGKCKPMGLMKCFPAIDLAPNPYRFETRSINTIIGLESSFSDMITLIKAAHMVKQLEAGKQLPFDGLFGAKLFLIHRKIKSGGKNVFITDMEPTPEFVESIMEPIKRGLAAKAKHSMLVGEAGSVSLLGEASARLLGVSKAATMEAEDAESVPIDLDSQREVAVNFGADAGDIDEVEGGVAPSSEIPKDLGKQAVEALMDSEKSPKK
jgi:hypothetical protein